MSSTDDWIAPLAERCLTSYLSGIKDPELQIQDDGSNLRFTDSTVRRAVVYKLKDRERIPIPDLTDSQSQIQASLTKRSMEEFRKESPDRQLCNDAARGYIMQLVDFELVFEYSALKPEVHLYVKRFNIEWNRGRLKSYRASPKLNKNRQVYNLMQKAFAKIKESAKKTRGLASTTDGYRSDTSIRSQNGRNLRRHQGHFASTGASQEIFASQAPHILNPQPRSYPTNINGHSTKSGNLLGLLGARGSNTPGSHEHSGKHSSAHLAVDSAIEYQSNNVRHSPGKHDVRPEPVPDATNSPQLNTSIEVLGLKSAPNANGSIGDSNVTSDAENGPYGPVTYVEEDPFRQTKDKERIKVDNRTSDGVVYHPKRRSPLQSNPWGGLTRIPENDVKIPEDQKDLLENNRYWVPPEPGKSMPQGHVPPPLLQEWNKIAMRRSRLAEKKEMKELEPETLPSNRHRSTYSEVPPSSFQTDSDPSSDEIEWPSSPERDQRPQNELPADSSPVAVRRARKTASPPKQQNAPEVSLLDGHDPASVEDTAHNPPVPSSSQNVDAVVDHTYENHDPVQRNVPEMDSGPQIQAADDSDNESDDSIMDTSVPCALGDRLQQTQSTNQSEPEITSSGPSLPGFGPEQIQVVETPAANLSRLRSERFETERSETTLHGSQPKAPAAAKSSSQSRISNTYHSNRRETDKLFQEIPNGSLQSTDHSVSVDIMGTQISGGNWSMPDIISGSQSAFVLDSSGPSEREQAVPLRATVAQPEGISAPFSSYRDTLLSQSDGGQFPNLFSSTQNTQDEHDIRDIGARSLKRFLSDEVEEPSPSKRHRVEHRTGSKDPASTIMSRRESYITSATKHAEALRIYEKFRSDYKDYTGDFAHFTKLCSDLQSLRNKGSLKRSFLWDDFIIMHLQGYPGYIELCLSTESKSLVYEEYFTTYFSKPSHKKRSLTADSIEVSAAQYESTTATSPPRVTNPSLYKTTSPPREVITSFTTSLVNKLSSFHAHSFETTQDQPDANLGWASSPARANGGNQPDNYNDPMIWLSTPVRSIEPRHTAVPETQPEEPMEGPIEEPVEEPEVQGTPEPQENIQNTQPSARKGSNDAEINGDDDKMEDAHTNHPIPEDINDDEDENMEAAHSTASIELGDETSPTAPPPHPFAQVEIQPTPSPEPEPEIPDSNENWFSSLRHIRPIPGEPVWSDDPNTPFKKWAEADLNLRIDRNRRGNRYIPVDEAGVVKRGLVYRGVDGNVWAKPKGKK